MNKRPYLHTISELQLNYIHINVLMCALAPVFPSSFFSKVTTRPVSARMVMFWTIFWKFVNPLVMIIIFLGAGITELVDPLQYVAYDVSKRTHYDIVYIMISLADSCA